MKPATATRIKIAFAHSAGLVAILTLVAMALEKPFHLRISRALIKLGVYPLPQVAKIRSSLDPADNWKMRVVTASKKDAPQLVPFGGGGMPVPKSAQPANVRLMPFPFYNYFSIANDADSTSWKKFRKIHEFLDDRLGLNLSDSVFVRNSPRSSLPLDSNSTIQLTEINQRLTVTMMDWYRRGWFDTLHSWGNPSSFLLEKPEIVISASDPAKIVAQDVNLKWVEGNLTTTEFIPKIIQNAPLHYLGFVYELPTGGRFRFTVNLKDGKEIWSSSWISEGTLVERKYYVQVPNQVTSELMLENATAKIEFSGMYPDKVSTLSIRGLALSTLTPESVAADAEALKKVNLFFPIWTTHSFPYIGVLGIENLHSAGRGELAAVYKNITSDNPRSPFYMLPSLDSYGVEFILPANRTAIADKVPRIDNLVAPFMFGDGGWRYSFQRWFSYPREYDTKYIPNLSWHEALGLEIGLLLKQSKLHGEGGVLYTHWGVGSVNYAKDFLDWNDETREAFGILSERYYGLTRSGDILGEDQRVWVSPVINVLKYSQVVQAIAAHSFYDATTNQLHILSWSDPVTNRRVPNLENPGQDLQGVTFYVENASAAEVYVDGQLYKGVQRNVPDKSGRSSITLVNSSPYVPVFEGIPHGETMSASADARGCSFAYADKLIDGHSQVNFRPKEIHLVREQGPNNTSGDTCKLTWRPRDLDNSSATHIQVEFRTMGPPIDLTIGYQLEDGSEYWFDSDGQPTAADEPTNKFSGNRTVSTITAPIAESVLFFRDLKRLGRGKLRKVMMAARGLNPSNSLIVSQIGFLRQGALPEPTDGFAVAGHGNEKVQPDGFKVNISFNEGRKQRGFVLPLSTDGSFVLPVKVPKGAIVTIKGVDSAGKIHIPKQGVLYVANRNLVPIEFKFGF